MVQLPDRLAIIDSNLLSDRPFLVDHMTGVFVRLIVKHNIVAFNDGKKTFRTVLKRLQEAGMYETAYMLLKDNGMKEAVDDVDDLTVVKIVMYTLRLAEYRAKANMEAAIELMK